MAFRRGIRSARSIIDSDLELSASDDDSDNAKICSKAEEEDLLKPDEDDDSHAGGNEAAVTSLAPPKEPLFFTDIKGDTSQMNEAEAAAAAAVASANSKMIKTSTGKLQKEISGLSLDDGNLSDPDLDEVCRQRNIQGPPKGSRRRFTYFDRDRPITGARQKFYNFDPSSEISLADIIKAQKPNTIRRRQLPPSNPKASQTNNETRNNHRGPPTNYNNQDKLRKAVGTIIEQDPQQWHDSAQDNMQPTSQGFNLWIYIYTLIDMGYSIYTEVKTLTSDENLTENQKSRMFRCLVRYKDIEGVCEAVTRKLAQQGAAANFYSNLGETFPELRKFPTEIYEGYLIDAYILNLLYDKLRTVHGPNFRTHNKMTTYAQEALTYTRYTIFVNSQPFEGVSSSGIMAAKLLAAKKALLTLFPEEECPRLKFHVGKEQCTPEAHVDAIYRPIYSDMTHCYDLTKVDIVPQGTMRLWRSSNGRGLPRQDRAVYVPSNSGAMLNLDQ